MMAMPWPPPTHIVSRPNCASRSCIPLSSVVVMRAPVDPNGWPSAIAPPLTLSLSKSIPGERGETELGGLGVAHDHHGSGGVVEGAAVAGGDRAVGPEHRVQAADTLD